MSKGLIAFMVIIVLLVIALIIGGIIWATMAKKRPTYIPRERYDINDNFVSLNLASSFLDSLSVSNNKVTPTVSSILTKYNNVANLSSPQKQIINENV